MLGFWVRLVGKGVLAVGVGYCVIKSPSASWFSERGHQILKQVSRKK
jgi:hypothetical protein